MLHHMDEILTALRSANVALCWLMLHGAGGHRKLRAAVEAAAPSPASLLGLLLDTAVLEFEVCC